MSGQVQVQLTANNELPVQRFLPGHGGEVGEDGEEVLGPGGVPGGVGGDLHGGAAPPVPAPRHHRRGALQQARHVPGQGGQWLIRFMFLLSRQVNVIFASQTPLTSPWAR